MQCDESMAGTMLGLFYDSNKMQATIEAWLTALEVAAERVTVPTTRRPGSDPR